MTASDEAERDFFTLTHEIVRLMGADDLFTCAIHPEADGTNNESERRLRQAALDRRTGRTNKTERGARRRTVITSVLDALRVPLPKLTPQTVQSEIDRWRHEGGQLLPPDRRDVEAAAVEPAGTHPISAGSADPRLA